MAHPKTQQIIDAAIARFIETGNDSTAAELAERSGIGIATVRKVLSQHGGCPVGLRSYQEARPSYSRNYRGFESGHHLIRLYGPTRETLRALLIAARGDVTTKDGS